MKTLVIVSHPYFARSNAIKAVQQAVESLPGVTVRNLEALYGDYPAAFDIAAEQAAVEAAERIVFLFPIHWFNLTPMLKAYLNEVWSYGWAFGPNGTALKGKTLQAVVTAGASEHTYSAEGLIESSIEEVLTPLKASALYVGMTYLPPLALFGAMGADAKTMAGFEWQVRCALGEPALAD
jgi:glutathione-regulated potassium-efflux system ancillary protein KefF